MCTRCPTHMIVMLAPLECIFIMSAYQIFIGLTYCDVLVVFPWETTKEEIKKQFRTLASLCIIYYTRQFILLLGENKTQIAYSHDMTYWFFQPTYYTLVNHSSQLKVILIHNCTGHEV